MKRYLSATLILALVGVTEILLNGNLSHTSAADPAPTNAALERARRETKMLDELYKNAIVLITKHYVEESSDLPAGSAFKVLFQTMKESGWHEVRLLDGLGDPINEENLPQDEFEKAGIQAVLDGKASFEKVETRNGKPVLRTVTTLPMVMDKCIMCHENYKDKKIVGGLGYSVPIQAD